MKNLLIALLSLFFGLEAYAAVMPVTLVCSSSPKIRSGTLDFPFEKSEWTLTYGPAPMEDEIECRVTANQPVILTVDGVSYRTDKAQLFESFLAQDARAFCESVWARSGPRLFEQSDFIMRTTDGKKAYFLMREVASDRFLPDASIVFSHTDQCHLVER